MSALSLHFSSVSGGNLRVDDVAAVRAEDASGSFGILPGHADFLTLLPVGVVGWRHHSGREGHCAVRGGVLLVEDGERVVVATRELVHDDDLPRLESTVLRELRRRDDAERSARVESTLAELRVAREILRYLRPPAGRA